MRKKLLSIFVGCVVLMSVAGASSAATAAVPPLPAYSGTCWTTINSVYWSAGKTCSYAPGKLSIYSPNGQYSMHFQSDGNLVVYRDGKALWSTSTHNRGATELAFQNDGNIVIYAGQKALWWTGMCPVSSWGSFYMQNDGNLVKYNISGTGAQKAEWSRWGHRSC